MSSTKPFTIGIDLSGGKLKACIFKDDRAEFIDLVKEEINLHQRTKAYVSERVKALVDDVLQRVGISAEDCDAIGVACPGNSESEIARGVDDPENSFTFIKDFLYDQYHIPVYLENDADMGALGEHAFGAGQNARSMVLLFLGNSVGSGLILGGSLYRGGDGKAGGVGQMIIDEQGISDWYRCPMCKNRGCADSMASETAIVVLAKDALRKGGQIKDYTFEDIASISVPYVIEAAIEGDATALEIVNTVAGNISVLIYNIIVTLDPDVLVVGGRLSRYFDFLLPMIETQLAKKNLQLKNSRTQVVPSQIPGDIGLLGALIVKQSDNYSPKLS